MPFTTRGISLMFGWSFLSVARPVNFYLALFTSALTPTVATKIKSELTEIAAGNGYSAGGYQLSPTAADFTSLTEDDTNHRVELALKTITLSASGGDIPPSGNPAYYAGLTTDEATLGNRQILWYMPLRGGPRVVSSGNSYALIGIAARILGGPMIRSIQRGTITFTGTTATGTATITAVDTAKASVNSLGYSIDTATTGSRVFDSVRVTLTNATTVTATRSAENITASIITVQFEVIEYF